MELKERQTIKIDKKENRKVTLLDSAGLETPVKKNIGNYKKTIKIIYKKIIKPEGKQLIKNEFKLGIKKDDNNLINKDKFKKF